MQETAVELTNLAISMANDGTIIKDLTQENQHLSTETTMSNATLVTVVADIAALRAQLQSLTTVRQANRYQGRY